MVPKAPITAGNTVTSLQLQILLLLLLLLLLLTVESISRFNTMVYLHIQYHFLLVHVHHIIIHNKRNPMLHVHITFRIY